VLILRIKQAEKALADGRLDEAFDIAQNKKVQAHRRGQSLVNRLVQAYLARCREHLQAERFSYASAECDKAIQLGGNLAEATEMRAEITKAMNSRQRRQREQADVIATVKNHINNGRITLGEHLLEKSELDTEKAQSVQANVNERRLHVEDATTRAQRAIEHEDWDTAVTALLEIKRSHAANKQLTELMTQLTGCITTQAKSAINEGRVDLAESLLHRLVPLGQETVETRDLNRIVEQCRLAVQHITCHQLRQANEILRRISAIQPEASWVKKTLNQIQQAADTIEDLHSGPLGLLMDQPTATKENHTASTLPCAHTARL